MARLSDYFSGVILKRLSAVETDPGTSNQHEYNGTREMKQLFGLDRRTLPTRYIYLGHDEEDSNSIDGIATWYDSRERHPIRSEYRLYFKDNDVTARAREGDVLIIGLKKDMSIILLIVDGCSPQLDSVLWLFGASSIDGLAEVQNIHPDQVERKSLALFNHIAEYAGLDIEAEPTDDWLDLLLSRFGSAFPSTRELSALALETLQGDVSATEAPDRALLDLVDREEVLFRQLERHIVSRHLEQHATSWASDVDAFVKFSLSVHNRRKSRAGHALENQLEWIFLENHIRYQRGAVTENKSKPDFLFPGASKYHDETIAAEYLTMLGVKTSCKDRWRQVLNEAKRIEHKHLMTLQPAISEAQTDEMEIAHLTLVIPSDLQESYSSKQRKRLLSLGDFMAYVSQRNATIAK